MKSLNISQEWHIIQQEFIRSSLFANICAPFEPYNVSLLLCYFFFVSEMITHRQTVTLSAVYIWQINMNILNVVKNERIRICKKPLQIRKSYGAIPYDGRSIILRRILCWGRHIELCILKLHVLLFLWFSFYLFRSHVEHKLHLSSRPHPFFLISQTSHRYQRNHECICTRTTKTNYSNTCEI